MSQDLTEVQNVQLGVVTAVIEGLLLQPTMYWKNARQQKLPFTVDPRIIYRGTGAAICNEMGQLGLQFGLTGYFQKLFTGDTGKAMTPYQEFMSATLGGGVAAVYAAPVELVMIQQQRIGGTLWGTPLRVAREHGLLSGGLGRGLLMAIGRDSIYVSGLLGVAPICTDYFMRERGMSQMTAGLWASLIGGVSAAVFSHPMDVIKTCMQGDLGRATYGGTADTAAKLWRQGGAKRMFDGCFWRTVNITATVFIANECRMRLPRHLFPDRR
mmetsp:Transcript_54644/g.153741  ORF Transcript_54644/g.153741 Transcript_54644/m.153741 type:complete len:269 (+) Transcript_54644:44-850(+)